MNKQRLLELAGIIEAQHTSSAQAETMINIFMRYASDNWEDDVWQDAVHDLIWRLLKADPGSAQDFVEGNLDKEDIERYGEPEDQTGVPVGNRRDWG